ncbi:MAG TPA: hypothetical protein VLA37_09525 [Sphingomonadaceae bacterium]|nr:hypothetical protein [Sphingomonadaceae bacterium]
MSERGPIFKVIVTPKGVALEKIKRGRPGYRKARKGAILRQRDAIELFRKLKASRRGVAGGFAFQFLDTARTFAMLQLQARQAAIQDNLDEVLAYDGSKNRSAGDAALRPARAPKRRK